jgi:hypothetical protein
MKPNDPRYEGAYYPGIGCYLYAVADGKRQPLVSAGDWSVCQCRDYAAESGFTSERTYRDGGIVVFVWERPLVA